MKTLQIDKTNAKKLFSKASPEFKQMLIDTFGKEYFSDNIMDRIKTFEDACAEIGISNDSCMPIYDEEESKDEIAYKKLKVIIRALNEGWEPDWTNKNEYKWYPWFIYKSSGFCFSGSDAGYVYANADVGSRLCFKSEELANYAGKQFESIYNDFLN